MSKKKNRKERLKASIGTVKDYYPEAVESYTKKKKGRGKNTIYIKLVLIIILIAFGLWVLKDDHGQNICHLDNDDFCVTVQYPKVISLDRSFNTIFTFKRKRVQPFVIDMILVPNSEHLILNNDDWHKKIDMTSKNKDEWCPTLTCRFSKPSSSDALVNIFTLVNTFKGEKLGVVAFIDKQGRPMETYLCFKIKSEWLILVSIISFLIASVIGIHLEIRHKIIHNYYIKVSNNIKKAR